MNYGSVDLATTSETVVPPSILFALAPPHQVQERRPSCNLLLSIQRGMLSLLVLIVVDYKHVVLGLEKLHLEGNELGAIEDRA